MNLVPRRFFFDDDFDDFMPTLKSNMKCDVYEMDGSVFIEVDMPGFSRDNIDIDVENKYLTITAEKKENNDSSDKNYKMKERRYSKMTRSFYVGNVSEDNIKAELKDGVLKITVPKEEKQDSKKKIEID